MHSWHCGVAARIAPNSRGELKVESGIPTIDPLVSMGSITDLGCWRRPPPPWLAFANVSLNSSRRMPMASYFSSPQPIGSIRLWHDAHVGLVTCSDIRSRLVCGCASEEGGRFVFTPAGGGGTLWQRKCS